MLIFTAAGLQIRLSGGGVAANLTKTLRSYKLIVKATAVEHQNQEAKKSKEN